VRPTLLLTHAARALAGPGAPCAGQTVVAGLSGGPDSVAMLDALLLLAPARGFRVIAAHLDHGLRPGAKDDAAFCRELCGRLGVPLREGSADVAARARRDGGGVEEAAREERYAFLRGVKEKEEAAAIAVAHTRDDQAETLLLRLVRGAGRRGLAAMRERSGDLWRPLLAVSRAEVLDHLRARALPSREDPTNADPSFLRNRVRAELLPYLESRLNPSARETLARAAALLAEEDDLLAELAGALWTRVARRDGPAAVLDREALRRAPRALARRALRRALEETGGLRGVGHDHVEKLLALAGGGSGRRLPLPGGREACVRFEEIRIGPRVTAAGPFAFDLPVPGRVELPGGQAVRARPARGPASAGRQSAVVAVPAEPLVVRSRRAGDRVRAGSRDVSLKRFLMDRRVPADLRPWLPLVAAGNLVLWVPGLTPGRRAGGRGGREVERSETSANPAYTTRRASVAPRILGGAPLAPPSSRRFVRLELQGAEVALR